MDGQGAEKMSPQQGHEDSSQSQQLADALAALLQPLRLAHNLDLHQDVEKKVHVCRRSDGLHKQELCFIRLQEAPPPPQPPKLPAHGVRIGGGYYIPELHSSAVAAAAAAARVRERRSREVSTASREQSRGKGDEDAASSLRSGSERRTGSAKRLSAALAAGAALSSPARSPRRSSQAQSPGPVLLGRSTSPEKLRADSEIYAAGLQAEVQATSAGAEGEEEAAAAAEERNEALSRSLPSAFAFGEPPRAASSDVRAAGYHFGTFTRGETRCYRGDRRQCSGKARYEDFCGPPPRGDGTFRVLSNERRRRQSVGASAERASGSAEGAAEMSREPRWHGPGAQALDSLLGALGLSVPGAGEEAPAPEVHRSECCVGGRWQVELCYLCADRTTERPVEVTVEKEVEVPVRVEVEKPRPPEAATGCQTTTIWCANCGAPGHGVPDCPLLKLQQQVRQLQLRERQRQSPEPRKQGCQLCGAAVHLAPDCPLLPKQPRTKDGSVQTDLVCQLCDRPGHAAPKCPLLAQLVQGRGNTDCMPSKIRVGGGWLLAPEVPGLGQAGLDEVEALKALAAANAAGCMAKDGRVVYTGSRRSTSAGPRPRSAPSGGRRCSSSPRGAQATQTSPRGGHGNFQAHTFAPKAASRFLGPGQMGPERFKAMEEERAALTQRIRSGQNKSPERHRGYVFGTYVQGRHDRHKFSSDKGPRTAFRVYRSGITKDATLDPAVLKKSTSMQSLRTAESSIAREDEEGDTLLSTDGEDEAECLNASDFSSSHCPLPRPKIPEIVVTPAKTAVGAPPRPPHLKACTPEPLSSNTSRCPSTREETNLDLSISSGPSTIDPPSTIEADASMVSRASSAREML
eukprot:TRINITY_DN7129_c0_g1_i2.p1 TRINITY_DN7129_c0_g1~~TRINITY_DN7129_c0_g1_i2.p1  ORF type:complete len:868 (+),score=164.81 TRINITY_DN7129_c0_g1_i2:35-2605(+)